MVVHFLSVGMNKVAASRETVVKTKSCDTHFCISESVVSIIPHVDDIYT